MTTAKKNENRKRCLECSEYSCNGCSLMCNANVFQIDDCILDNSSVKEIKEGTPEWFMFKYDPTLFLKYLNYQRKERLPDVGTKVVTLRAGFGGWSGDIRCIKEIDEKYITLSDDNGKEYMSDIKTWYGDFFELQHKSH